jgi:hypothetical protein
VLPTRSTSEFRHLHRWSMIREGHDLDPFDPGNSGDLVVRVQFDRQPRLVERHGYARRRGAGCLGPNDTHLAREPPPQVGDEARQFRLFSVHQDRDDVMRTERQPLRRRVRTDDDQHIHAAMLTAPGALGQYLPPNT